MPHEGAFNWLCADRTERRGPSPRDVRTKQSARAGIRAKEAMNAYPTASYALSTQRGQQAKKQTPKFSP